MGRYKRMLEANLATPPDGMPQPARNRAMLVIIVGLAMAVLDGSIVNLALPGIANELNASAAHSVWVVNAYQMATLVLLLPLASLGDRIGYRRVYLVGMALFGAASILAMAANTLPALIGARTLQGLGAAGIMSVNAAMVRVIYPRAHLGRGLAINALVVAFASVAGPTVAAAILSVASWHWLFALNVPLCAVTLYMGRKYLPHNAVMSTAPRPAILDVVLNVLMFTLIFFGGERLSMHGGAQSTPHAAITGGAMLVAGLLVGWWYLHRQWRLATPLFPIDLLRIPVFALSMVSSVTAFAAQTLAYLCLPFLLLEAYGRTPLQAGLLITAWPVAIAVVAPISGRLIDRYPDGLLGGIGMVAFACGLFLMAALPGSPTDVAIAWRLALCGAGFALFQSPNNHTIVTSAPLARSGAASGMLGTARLTGQTAGAVVLSALFAIWPPSDGLGEKIALVAAGVLALGAAVASTKRVRASHNH